MWLSWRYRLYLAFTHNVVPGLERAIAGTALVASGMAIVVSASASWAGLHFASAAFAFGYVGADSGVKSEFRFQCLGMHASGTWRLRSACGERGARHDVGLLIGSAGLALAA